MHLVYIDDSQDKPRYTFSAVAIPAARWAAIFSGIREFRRGLWNSDGIFITKELHAVDFCAGRGRVSVRVVTKWRRCEIFKEALTVLASLEGVRIFNSSLLYHQDWAFERLLNRINRTMQSWDSNALLICDEGKEGDYTRLVRRMSVHNPIPSRFGVWRDTGATWRNIPLDRIVEDPFFKKSDKSYFVQMADFCAYALLQRERPLPSRKKYGLHKAFERLDPVCVRIANTRDPLGIIR